MEWQARLYPVRNRIILTQLLIALGLPMVFLLVLLFLLSWPPDRESVTSILGVILLVAGILVFLLLLTLGILYRKGFLYRYRIDEDGITAWPSGDTARTNRLVNALLMLSGHPAPAGIGLLAHVRQEEKLAWHQVSSFVAEPDGNAITLYRGKRPVMVLACEEEDFSRVLACIETNLA